MASGYAVHVQIAGAAGWQDTLARYSTASHAREEAEWIALAPQNPRLPMYLRVRVVDGIRCVFERAVERRR